MQGKKNQAIYMGSVGVAVHVGEEMGHKTKWERETAA